MAFRDPSLTIVLTQLNLNNVLERQDIDSLAAKNSLVIIPTSIMVSKRNVHAQNQAPCPITINTERDRR